LRRTDFVPSRPHAALGRAALRRSPGPKVHWTFGYSRLTPPRADQWLVAPVIDPLDLAPPVMEPDIDPDIEPEDFAPFFLSAAILSWSDIIDPDIEPVIEPLAFGPDIDPDMEPLELDCAKAGVAANRARTAMVANFIIVFS
jgi:hypothetical protein